MTTSTITVVDLTEDENNTRSISVSYVIKSVACSPRETQEFTVAGSTNTVGSLEQYNFDIITGELTLNHIYTQPLEALTSITYNSNGHFLYVVGLTGNTIHKFNTDTYDMEQIPFTTTLPTGELRKVRVNKNENVIATVSINTVFVLEISNDTIVKATIVEEFPSGIASVALSPTGGNMFVVDTTLKGGFKGQCTEGFFYNTEFNTCTSCDGTCNICAITASTCYQCKDNFFLSGNACLDCPLRCKTCFNAISCTECKKPFVFVGQLCGCP